MRKTERNMYKNLLVWLDDGTEVIFSREETEAIDSRHKDVSIEDAIIATLLDIANPSMFGKEQEPEGCDLEETVGELAEIVREQNDIQENVLKNQRDLALELISAVRDIETLNRKVDSLASVVIGDGNKKTVQNKSAKKNNSIFSRG